MANDREAAANAAIENSLSAGARRFIRNNPAAWDNKLVMEALAYMDDLMADSEDKYADEHLKECDEAKRNGELQAMDSCETLIAAALYMATDPSDQDNIKELISEAKRADAYWENLKE